MKERITRDSVNAPFGNAVGRTRRVPPALLPPPPPLHPPLLPFPHTTYPTTAFFVTSTACSSSATAFIPPPPLFYRLSLCRLFYHSRLHHLISLLHLLLFLLFPHCLQRLLFLPLLLLYLHHFLLLLCLRRLKFSTNISMIPPPPLSPLSLTPPPSPAVHLSSYQLFHLEHRHQLNFFRRYLLLLPPSPLPPLPHLLPLLHLPLTFSARPCCLCRLRYL